MSRFVRRRTRTAVTRRRSSGMGTGPIVAFLLIASFGILFAGCSGPVKGPNDADTLEDSTFSGFSCLGTVFGIEGLDSSFLDF
jgi:hypothetical protein